MESLEPYLSYALALFAGLLIGLEREHSRQQHSRFIGGVRTFPLFALAGAIATSLAGALGPWPFVIAAAATSAFAFIGYRLDSNEGNSGLTTEGAFLVTFLLGALAGTHDPGLHVAQKAFIVASIAVVTTFLLSAKPMLHAFSSKISGDDVIATVKFLLVAVVVLPLLPDEPHGPFGVLNPFKVGLMVVLIAGVSFVGYAAARLLGPGRGLLLTGLVGGLVSSTAVTLAAAQRAKASPELATASALSIMSACVVMSIRVLVLAAVTNRELLARLLWPFAGMALAGAAVSTLLYLRSGEHKKKDETAELKNPFELSSAVKMTAVVVGVMLLSRWAQAEFGAVALYVTALLAGLADVDAITLSLATMSGRGEVTVAVATGSIFAAVAANTVTKGVMSLVMGSKALAARVAVGFTLMVAAGGAGLALQLLLRGS